MTLAQSARRVVEQSFQVEAAKRLLHTVIILCSVGCLASTAMPAELNSLTASSLPPKIKKALERNPGLKNYPPSADINPFYLHGDFNGDGQLDIALLVRQRSSGKRGVAILHGKTNQTYVLGAGRDFGKGGNDFRWMDAWYVYGRGTVKPGADSKPPPKLKGDALMLLKTESASALIYWNGKGYAWYQQGD